MLFLPFVYGYLSSCPCAHGIPNKSVPTLRYTRRHGSMPVGTYRVQSVSSRVQQRSCGLSKAFTRVEQRCCGLSQAFTRVEQRCCGFSQAFRGVKQRSCGLSQVAFRRVEQRSCGSSQAFREQRNEICMTTVTCERHQQNACTTSADVPTK